jgi:hypothetical protein
MAEFVCFAAVGPHYQREVLVLSREPKRHPWDRSLFWFSRSCVMSMEFSRKDPARTHTYGVASSISETHTSFCRSRKMREGPQRGVALYLPRHLLVFSSAIFPQHARANNTGTHDELFWKRGITVAIFILVPQIIPWCPEHLKRDDEPQDILWEINKFGDSHKILVECIRAWRRQRRG